MKKYLIVSIVTTLVVFITSMSYAIPINFYFNTKDANGNITLGYTSVPIKIELYDDPQYEQRNTPPVAVQYLSGNMASFDLDENEYQFKITPEINVNSQPFPIQPLKGKILAHSWAAPTIEKTFNLFPYTILNVPITASGDSLPLTLNLTTTTKGGEYHQQFIIPESGTIIQLVRGISYTFTAIDTAGKVKTLNLKFWNENPFKIKLSGAGNSAINGKIEFTVNGDNLSNYTIMAYIDSINKTDAGIALNTTNPFHAEQLITGGVNTINIDKSGLYKIAIRVTDKNTGASYYKPISAIVGLTSTNPTTTKKITIKPPALLDISIILLDKNGNKINNGTVSLKRADNTLQTGIYAENLMVGEQLAEADTQIISTTNKFKPVKGAKYIISHASPTGAATEKEIMFFYSGTVNTKLDI
jgi:hypothetical protein